jgi:hypothetical protein
MMNGGAQLVTRLSCLMVAIGLIASRAEPLPAGRAATGRIIHGPAAALEFARSYRGDVYRPDALTCYPDATGIPFADCANIIPMHASLWTPRQLVADFRRRMESLPVSARARGIIVLLKTERCATKEMRGCTVTTAALEKRSTPLVAEFLVYGVLLKPRDRDRPPGSLRIETGEDEWKNDAAGEYLFHQGPGATLAFIDPNSDSGRMFDHTDAIRLQLTEENFKSHGGQTPELENKLQEILARWK